MCDAMKKKISETKCFLIDGYPRELEQGTRFEKEVKKNPGPPEKKIPTSLTNRKKNGKTFKLLLYLQCTIMNFEHDR